MARAGGDVWIVRVSEVYIFDREPVRYAGRGGDGGVGRLLGVCGEQSQLVVRTEVLLQVEKLLRGRELAPN